MKRKRTKRAVNACAVFLAGSMVVGSLAGCGAKDSYKEIDTIKVKTDASKGGSNKSEKGKLENGVALMSLKDFKGAYVGSSTVERQAPLYNIAPKQMFTFHFKTKEKLDPIKAVTIHTDAKCLDDSRIFTINYEYLTTDGADLIISPSKMLDDGVMSCADRLDNESAVGTWGNAQIYYISINYDLNSEKTEKLDKSIVIPFTVRNDVETPTLKAGLNKEGDFELSWLPIKGVDKYRVYRSYNSTDANESRRERAYIGEHIELLKELDGSETTFAVVEDTESGGDIIQQNMMSDSNYYVTAVRDGKESAFSYDVSSLRYRNRLPQRCNLNYGSEYAILPLTLPVLMADKKTEVSMPAEYELVSNDYGVAVYKYHIVGTKLTGTVKLKYEDESKLEKEVPAFQYEYLTKELDSGLPNTMSSKDVITRFGQKNSFVDVAIYTGYDEDSLVKIDRSTYYWRIDQEVARGVTNGVYLDSYEDKDYINHAEYPKKRTDRSILRLDRKTGEILENGEIDDFGGDTWGSKNSSSSGSGDSVDKENSSDEISQGGWKNSDKHVSDKEDEREKTDAYEEDEDAYEENDGWASKDDEDEPEDTEEDKYDDDEELDENDGKLNREEKEELDEDDELDEEEEVYEDSEGAYEDTDGSDIEIEVTDYMIIADSAEEAYIANAFINSQEVVPLKEFPSLLDAEYLVDNILKVYYQNPYANAPDFQELQFDDESLSLLVTYTTDKDVWEKKKEEIREEAGNILSSTVKESMTDEEKVRAIWDYLEDNTEYDHAALEYAQAHNMTASEEFNDSFNCYGILVNKVGVCQSYGYTMNALLNEVGVKCRMLVGDIGPNMPHGWNIVTIDGKEYWIDSTNNAKSAMIPFMLYNTTSGIADDLGYTLDMRCEIDSVLRDNKMFYTTDDSKDYYVENGYISNSKNDLADKLVEQFNGDDTMCVRLNWDLGEAAEFIYSEDFIVDLVTKMKDAGLTKEQVLRFNGGIAKNYAIFFFQPE